MAEAVGILGVFGLATAVVAAVTEAVEAAATHAIKKPASYAVIANPHEEIVKMVELSASRWRKKKGDE